MRITPVQDNVLVELDPSEDAFGDSGILRPDIARDKPTWGTVRAKGRGRVTRKGALIPVPVGVGDRVYVRWAKGHDLYIGGLCHVMIRADDIDLTERT